MDNPFASARSFIQHEARLLERRVFGSLFESQSPDGVLAALRGYQNADGGFGHALEPDTRCPQSLPIYVETALNTMVMAGARDAILVNSACDFLAKVAQDAGASGAVPLAFAVIESYPRAAHWTDWTYAPSLNPTAGLVGLLHQLDMTHPWIDQAAEYCWGQLDANNLPDDGHSLSEVLLFLESAPADRRTPILASAIGKKLTTASFFRANAADPGYGVTPLHIAPTPDSKWHSLFTDEQIEGHLDQLLMDQQDDGGWAISWEPPSAAALLEWRGVETLRALNTLHAYGRIKLETVADSAVCARPQ